MIRCMILSCERKKLLMGLLLGFGFTAYYKVIVGAELELGTKISHPCQNVASSTAVRPIRRLYLTSSMFDILLAWVYNS